MGSGFSYTRKGENAMRKNPELSEIPLDTGSGL
jgi:hypothetical protein